MSEQIVNIILDVCRNLTPVLGEISETIRFSIDENFEKEGRYDGKQSGINLLSGGSTKWKNLAPSTVKQRKKKGYYPINILRQTGILASSITVQPSGSNAVTMGTNIEYAKYINFGTSKMPARPFLVLQEEDIADIKDIIQEHITKQLQ